MQHFTQRYAAPLGGVLLASDGKALTGLWFDGQKYFAKNLAKGSRKQNLTVFSEAARWLDLYFSGKVPDFTPALRPAGTPFQCEVWNILLHIPRGATMGYGEIAHKIAQRRGLAKMSAQAVGGAVARNPISIIIPCHRVVGAGGNLTGYSAGIARKIRLLQLEGVDTGKFFMPARGTAL